MAKQLNNQTDIKALIVILSLVGTLGGWALFSRQQADASNPGLVQNSGAAVYSQQLSESSSQPRSSDRPQLRQVSSANLQLSSRSSR